MADIDVQPPANPTTDTAPTIPDYLATPNAVFADQGVQWRYGRAPDYSKTRRVWEEGKKANHTAGSLPQLVENLVKNWEVEASFKSRLQDWRTIDQQNYTFAMNGGCPQSAEHMLKAGTYNAIIEPNEYYSPEHSDFASSHKTFKRMMPTFAWEVMEVYSGPPIVAFRWRHWGVMKNDYVGFNYRGQKVTAKAHGGPIEIFGVTVAQVDDKFRLQGVHTWMDPLAMFRQIAPYGVVNKETSNHKMDMVNAFDTNTDCHNLPDRDGIKIAQEHNEPNGEHLDDHAPQELIPKHISRDTGQPSDAFQSQISGCPFASHPNMTSEEAHAFSEALPVNAKSDRSNAVNGEVINNWSLQLESLIPEALPPTAAPMSSGNDVNAAQFDMNAVQDDVDAAQGAAQPAHTDEHHVQDGFGLNQEHAQSAQVNGDRLHASTQIAAEQVIEREINEPGARMKEHATVAGADFATPESSDILNRLETSSETHEDQPPANHSHEEEILPPSIYSSAATGNIEDVIKVARSDDFIDESITAGTYDAVDQHLESSADIVHAHPKDVEELVKPHVGQAVSAPAESEETQKTREEMSNISPDECPFMMNRE